MIDEPLVQSCRALLRAQNAELEALQARDAALQDWWRRHRDDRPPIRKVWAGEVIMQMLGEAGFTDEEVRKLGVSRGNVRAILDRGEPA